MKTLIITRKRFDLEKFLSVLHRFSRGGGRGNPLDIAEGGFVHEDTDELYLEDDEPDIPDDSLGRLEQGWTLFATFARLRCCGVLECADGSEVEVPDLDEQEEDTYGGVEDRPKRRRRTKKYVERVENTVCDECHCYGFLIDLSGDRVEIEAALLYDGHGDQRVEVVEDTGLIEEPMKAFLRAMRRVPGTAG